MAGLENAELMRILITRSVVFTIPPLRNDQLAGEIGAPTRTGPKLVSTRLFDDQVARCE